MINEFSVHPKPTNNKAKIVFFITVIAGLAVSTVSCFLPIYKGLVGMVGLLLIVTALLFYTKYIAIEFYYDIVKDDDGLPLLVVRQTIGKRTTTLCRIELADITKVETESAAERRAHKTERGVLKYNYTPTFSPSEVHRITVINRYERAEIVIEGSRELADMLRTYSAEARKIREIVEENEY